MSSPSLLTCTDLHVSHATSGTVLAGVGLEIARGEVVGLLGPNGAGKSTLLRVVAGIQRPDRGSVVLDGRELTSLPPGRAARAGVAHVSGRNTVFPTLSVADHLRLAIRPSSGTNNSARRFEPALELFPRLRDRLRIDAGSLSGGEQRQLALASAVLSRPTLLLVDELSMNLASGLESSINQMVRDVVERDGAVVVVDQSADAITHLATRVCVLDRGRIDFDGDLDSLADRARSPARFLLHAAGAARRTSAITTREPALELSSVTRRFGGVVAVDDVSVVVERGTVMAVIGPNGAGKTTLADLITGVVAADAGEIRFEGRNVTHLGIGERARLGFGRTFQDPVLFPSLTVQENLAVAHERHLDVREHVASVFALPDARAMEADLADRVGALLDLLDLEPWRHLRPNELSSGTRRAVELAMQLAHQPRLLVLDEPAAGLSEVERDLLPDLLATVRDATDCTTVVVEHHLDLVGSLADTVVVMDRGRIVADGGPDEVLANHLSPVR